jgi:hypothetical protein
MSAAAREAVLGDGLLAELRLSSASADDHLELRLVDARLVGVAGDQGIAAGARRRGDPQVVVADVPAVLPAQEPKASPFVDDG